jgi:hypothetical protein
LILQEAVDEEDSSGFLVGVGVMGRVTELWMYLVMLFGEEEDEVFEDVFIDLSLLFSPVVVPVVVVGADRAWTY